MLSVSVIAIIAIVYLLVDRRKFTTEKWEYVNNVNYTYGHPGRILKREAIYKDLLENYELTGKTQAQIKRFLGKPDQVVITGRGVEWKYEIVTEYAGDGDITGEKMLEVKFEAESGQPKVQKAAVRFVKR